jgi:hypothetical protein
VPVAIDRHDGETKRFALPIKSYSFKFDEVVKDNPYATRDSQYERYHKLELEEEARQAEIRKKEAEERARREEERKKKEAEDRVKFEAEQKLKRE